MSKKTKVAACADCSSKLDKIWEESVDDYIWVCPKCDVDYDIEFEMDPALLGGNKKLIH